jgi:hypothetical protein
VVIDGEGNEDMPGGSGAAEGDASGGMLAFSQLMRDAGGEGRGSGRVGEGEEDEEGGEVMGEDEDGSGV